VLCTIIAIFLAAKINFNSISARSAFLLGLGCALIPMFSFPASFALGAFLIIQAVRYKKSMSKNLVLFSVPFFIGVLLYYHLVILALNKSGTAEFMSAFWRSGFIKQDFSNFIPLIIRYFTNYFFPNNAAILGIILFFTGIYYSRKNLPVLLTLVCAAVASYMCIYPIREHVALYLVPAVIILMIKPLDFISFNRKIYSCLLLLCALIYFGKYNAGYLKNFFSEHVFWRKDGRTLVKIMKQNYRPGELVIVNNASVPTYIYYSKLLGFRPDKYVFLDKSTDNYDDKYLETINALPRNETVWFYYNFRYGGHNPMAEILKEWSKDKTILHEVNAYNGAYLLQITK
jgi:hypothetical protein